MSYLRSHGSSHRRSLAGALTVGAALLAWVLPAGALSYALRPVTVSPSHGLAGATFEVSGGDCPSQVYNSRLPRRADAKNGSSATVAAAILNIHGGSIASGMTSAVGGKWSIELTPPADTRPGTYDVNSSCQYYDSYSGGGSADYDRGSYTVDFPATAPTGTGDLTVNVKTVKAGDAVKVEGTGNPDDEMNIALYSDPVRLTSESVPTGADGKFSATVTIPSGTPDGEHTLVAINMESRFGDVVLTSPITVAGATTAATPTESGNLAQTGSDGTVRLVFLGLTLTLLGAGSTLGARRLRARRVDV